MVSFLKKNFFIILAIAVLLIAFEVLSSIFHMFLLSVGLFLLILSNRLKKEQSKKICLIIGIFFLILTVLLTQSVWVFVLSILLFFLLFQGDQGNEFLNFGESFVHPFKTKNTYVGVTLVQPQSGQRTLLKRQSISNAMSQPDDVFPWDDINLVYFGGSAIIDLGNTILPNGESIVMLRKVMGRTRFIIPRDAGLKINVSAIRGKVVFESQSYELVGENLQWESPNYAESSRQIKLIISIAMGEVEVIIL